MGAGPAEVDSGHGRPRFEPLVPHVGRQDLALEDVPSGQAHLFLDIRRPHDVHVQDGVRDVAAEAPEGVQRQSSHFLPPGIPVALGERVGHELGEDAHGVTAGWRHAAVVGGVEVEFLPQTRGKLAPIGHGVERVPLPRGERDIDLSAVVVLVRSGPADEIRQCHQRHVDLNGRPGLGYRFHAVLPRSIGLIAEEAQRHPGIGIRYDDRRPDALAALELHTLARQYTGDRHAGGHDSARIPGDIAQNEGDRTHASFDVPPHAGHPGHGSRGVKDVDGGGPGLMGAGVRPDHPLADQGHAQPFVFQIPFDVFGHGPFEEQADGLPVAFEPRFDLVPRWRPANPDVVFAGWPEGLPYALHGRVHGFETVHVPG